MYIVSVLEYLFWPFMILMSYLAVRWALRVFEKRLEREETPEE
jgi:hypothetical protein